MLNSINTFQQSIRIKHKLFWNGQLDCIEEDDFFVKRLYLCKVSQRLTLQTHVYVGIGGFSIITSIQEETNLIEFLQFYTKWFW